MEDRTKFDRTLDIARALFRDLIAAGVDSDFASEVVHRIERKAGSYLPPINGTLHANLDDAKVN